MGMFKFDKRQVVDYIQHELRTISKFREPFKFITKTLTDLGHSITIESLEDIDLNQIKEQEGKNYHWSVIKHDKGEILIRRYRHHLTIYTKTDKSREVGEGDKKRMYHDTEYGAFTFNVNFERFGDKHDQMMDEYYDAPFTALNSIIKDLITLLVERGVHWVWNSVSLEREDHIEIELIFESNSISSLDKFCFCMEEIDQIYLTLFSENILIKKLESFKERAGEYVSKRYKIGEVITEVKDEYYHAAGITFLDAMNDDKEEWHDVYSLASYRYEEVFPEHLFLNDGEFYVDGGELEPGKLCRYKPEEEGKKTQCLYYKDTYPKENFLPLKKAFDGE